MAMPAQATDVSRPARARHDTRPTRLESVSPSDSRRSSVSRRSAASADSLRSLSPHAAPLSGQYLGF
eukprot:425967-Hanusia_phi.AAC.1